MDMILVVCTVAWFLCGIGSVVIYIKDVLSYQQIITIGDCGSALFFLITGAVSLVVLSVDYIIHNHDISNIVVYRKKE
jgi:uncharacterized protein YqgC (DUF456 family)